MFLWLSCPKLRIEETQVRHVPWVADVCAGLRVLQAVSSTADDFRDDVGSFPWGGELVDFLLLQAEHQVAYVEGPGAQPTTVIGAQLLLIGRGTG